MVELIVTEKPKSAQRIAEALADGKLLKKKEKGVFYYEVTHGKNDIIVGCAVGHLFGIAEKEKHGMKYPSFDVEWKPLYEVDKGGAFSKKYYDALKFLSKKVDAVTIACDFDLEGEVIGLNVLRFICRRKDGRRMKFSTLTKPDLVRAYENASPTIEWGLARAGETRHELDWYYGINLSRALTSSIKSAGMFKLLSVGRVQGPALKIVVEREKEIAAFKSEPFWQLELHGGVKSGAIVALHERDKFWKKDEVDAVYRKTKGKSGKVSDVKKQEFEQRSPTPFDLTTLQTEAYRCFGLNPKTALSIAQELYTSGYISYPRTSSQQLPAAIGYENVLKQLEKNPSYGVLCSELLKKGKLAPNNGKKSDPAHPAIFPTGVQPKKLNDVSLKVYDLIARRFMATFAEPAVRETVTISIDVEAEKFLAAGTRTKREGWHRYYGPYARMKEIELPEVKANEVVTQESLDILDKETKPPARFTPASIIKELEKHNLGTKATRADVVDTLFQRGYVSDRAIKATDLGMEIVETLEKYVPEVVDEELTRHFELEMEEIRESRKKGGDVLEEAKVVLTKILGSFKKKEKDVGAELFEATKSSEIKENTVGKCVKCSGTLMIKRGKFGRFVACSNYPECSVTFKLPGNGMVKTTANACEACSHPKILIIKKRKKPQETCINPDCETKVSVEVKKQISEKENSKCEKCSEGKMVVRKSVYGSFLGCNKFPKCRNIMKLQGVQIG